MEKHYVYKVPALRITGAVKPYKTLVQTAFARAQDCSAQTLMKHVVYEYFLRYLAEKGAKIIGKALCL